jgi:hypothetical protein
MVQGIRAVLAGEVFLSVSISGIVLSEYKNLGMHLTPVGTTYSMSHHGGLPRKFARI